uniref:ATPase AAA-type core domain-containing protein n=1 Tax=Amphimedon queenslandica TaxID=400682 RepID=A0A1X7ULY9_AMPQE
VKGAHEKAPHIKSVMIIGPRRTGKKSLLHTICIETGTNLFNLRSSNVAGKFPGKAGLNMLLHMIFKVAKACPPSVKLICHCEKTFRKKILKTDKTDPKRFKKTLPKILKGMKPEERVMIIGTSTRPFG